MDVHTQDDTVAIVAQPCGAVPGVDLIIAENSRHGLARLQQHATQARRKDERFCTGEVQRHLNVERQYFGRGAARLD